MAEVEGDGGEEQEYVVQEAQGDLKVESTISTYAWTMITDGKTYIYTQTHMHACTHTHTQKYHY